MNFEEFLAEHVELSAPESFAGHAELLLAATRELIAVVLREIARDLRAIADHIEPEGPTGGNRA